VAAGLLVVEARRAKVRDQAVPRVDTADAGSSPTKAR
jgi:hypothetical protein